MRKEVRERAFLPLAIPLGALAVIAVGTITFSRILLNVPKEIATAVAAMIAINILVVFGVVAVREKLSQSQLFMMMVAAVIPLVIGGAVAVGAVEVSTGEEHAEEEGPPSVSLIAQNLAFQPAQLEATAGQDFVISFDNRDNVAHNVAIFKGADATGQNVFSGEIITGPKKVTYQVPAQEPGSFFMLCEVHPTTMTGTIQIAAETAPKTGEPETAAASISANNLAFDKDELELTASTAVSLVFDNQEAQPHNFAIFKGEDASGDKVFTGDLVTGPRKVTYKLPPLEPGSYFFQCDIHPTTMMGRVTVS